MNRKQLGDFGEDRAARYLIERGWEIVERNYRFGRKEVDIIARKKDLCVFVEVKTRRTEGYGRGVESVDGRKRSRIARVATQFLAARNLTDVNVRFDVVSIDGETIEYIEGAFQAE